jgi:hypothetical protein
VETLFHTWGTSTGRYGWLWHKFIRFQDSRFGIAIAKRCFEHALRGSRSKDKQNGAKQGKWEQVGMRSGGKSSAVRVGSSDWQLANQPWLTVAVGGVLTDWRQKPDFSYGL